VLLHKHMADTHTLLYRFKHTCHLQVNGTVYLIITTHTYQDRETLVATGCHAFVSTEMRTIRNIS
jgi:hypothetical protein